MMTPAWQIILDGKVIAFGKKFNDLPFFDNTIGSNSKWRVYTVLSNPPRLGIKGNEVEGYYLELTTELLAEIRKFCSDMPNERVEFMDPEQPHKTVDIEPIELSTFRSEYKGKTKYVETYWYRNIGRGIWEAGQGISAILTPFVEGLFLLLARIVDLLPPLFLAVANIVGTLATSTTHILAVTIQSFHHMINAHAQITSTDLETKRKLKGVVHTNETNLETWDLMNKSMPDPIDIGNVQNSKQSGCASNFMFFVAVGIFLAILYFYLT